MTWPPPDPKTAYSINEGYYYVAVNDGSGYPELWHLWRLPNAWNTWRLAENARRARMK